VHNLIVRIGKFKAEVTSDKNCTRGIKLMKLTTDRHEASSGLSATAELLGFKSILWLFSTQLNFIIDNCSPKAGLINKIEKHTTKSTKAY